MAAEETKKGMSTGLKIGLGVVGLVVLAGIFGGGEPAGTSATGETAETAAIAAAAVEPIRVTARELAAAYEANEAGAQARYGTGPLLVSAEIASISLDFADKPFLVLVGPNQFMGPQAELNAYSHERAGTLAKGQKVELLCASVSESIGTAMLKDCAIR